MGMKERRNSYMRSKLTLIFIIIVSLGVLGAGFVFVPKAVSAKFFRDAHAFARARDYAGAERLFRQAVRWNPKSSESYVQLAITLERQNKFADAYSVLSEAEQKFGDTNPNSLRIQSEKGKVARYMGKEEESETLLKEVIAKRPGDALAHFRLGHIYYVRNEFAKAKVEYETAVRITPNSAQFHSALGAALLMLGDEEAALRELRLATNLDPDFPSSYNNLAEIYKRRSQYRTALSYVNYAIRLNPQKPDYHVTQGEIYEAMGEKEKAKASYTKTLELLVSAPPSGETLRASVEAKLKSLAQ